ncbi:MAG: cytochrome c biogenesis protein CcsA [Myxococcales bacterium]|nr:cytochrome c biogenesis protein CcsA [Myxococcales bacterium]
MTAEVVTTQPQAAFYVAMGVYLVASVLHLSSLAQVPKRVKTAASWAVVAAFIAHGVDIGWRGVEEVHPATSVREALGFLSWILVGAFIFLSRRKGLTVLGAFVAPLALIVLATARLSPSGDAMTGLSSLGRLHIASATIGVAIFCLATVVSVIYLLQERNLKSKNFDGVLFRSSASLETLDRLSATLVAIGFPIFTISMMLGGVWVAEREQGFGRVEYPIAAVTWLAFAALMLGRSASGLRGRRAALLTLVGFGAAMMVLALYVLRRSVSG